MTSLLCVNSALQTVITPRGSCGVCQLVTCNRLRRDHHDNSYLMMQFFFVFFYFCKVEIDVPVIESYADGHSQTYLWGLCFNLRSKLSEKEAQCREYITTITLVASLVMGIWNRDVYMVRT